MQMPNNNSFTGFLLLILLPRVSEKVTNTKIHIPQLNTLIQAEIGDKEK